jgi:hypothetical protein
MQNVAWSNNLQYAVYNMKQGLVKDHTPEFTSHLPNCEKSILTKILSPQNKDGKFVAFMWD